MVYFVLLVLFDFIEIVILIEFKMKFRKLIFWDGISWDLLEWIVNFRDCNNVIVFCINMINV